MHDDLVSMIRPESTVTIGYTIDTLAPGQLRAREVKNISRTRFPLLT
jgi:hypothetical protein